MGREKARAKRYLSLAFFEGGGFFEVGEGLGVLPLGPGEPLSEVEELIPPPLLPPEGLRGLNEGTSGKSMSRSSSSLDLPSEILFIFEVKGLGFVGEETEFTLGVLFGVEGGFFSALSGTD